ncbi:hypothetical protein SISNIDRAFT_487461 [Sistotremastrum niveocremeum HHB9708]|uniref:Uncharacterized protein n=1 Tax=Sistotremastrum niveocremeum HHB9708 TaxID=1314777 RepID=A0A164SHM1_9AGAM|nr:hypothetical protein SISNIDRAFT_487461 [Sistotremastrum niveocremeum HHB9708]
MYSLSRQQAILGNYWNVDPGDAQEEAADPNYGVDDGDDLEPEEVVDPVGEPVRDENGAAIGNEGDGEEDEAAWNLLEERVHWARGVIGNFDVMREDNQVGMNVYLEVLTLLETHAATLPV